MHSGLWVLVLVLLAGVIGRNPLVIIATAFLLLVAVAPLGSALAALERHSVPAGLTLLILGLLTPFATGRLGLGHMVAGLKGPLGLSALIGGALSAYMCAKGLILLELEPEIIVGLVAGTIIGVALFRGIPVGPLAAAGLTAILYEIMRWWGSR